MIKTFMWGAVVAFSLTYSTSTLASIRAETENDKAALQKNFFGAENDFAYKQRLALHYALEQFTHTDLSKNRPLEQITEKSIASTEKFNALKVQTSEDEESFNTKKQLIFETVEAAHREYNLLAKLGGTAEKHGDPSWIEEVKFLGKAANEGFNKIFGPSSPCERDPDYIELSQKLYEIYPEFNPHIFPVHLMHLFQVNFQPASSLPAKIMITHFNQLTQSSNPLFEKEILDEQTLEEKIQDEKKGNFYLKGKINPQGSLRIERLLSSSTVQVSTPELHIGFIKDQKPGVQEFTPEDIYGLLMTAGDFQLTSNLFDMKYGKGKIGGMGRFNIKDKMLLGRMIETTASMSPTVTRVQFDINFPYFHPNGTSLEIGGGCVLDTPLLISYLGDLDIKGNLFSYVKSYDFAGKFVAHQNMYVFNSPKIRSFRHKSGVPFDKWSAGEPGRGIHVYGHYTVDHTPKPVWHVKDFIQFMEDPSLPLAQKTSFETCDSDFQVHLVPEEESLEDFQKRGKDYTSDYNMELYEGKYIPAPLPEREDRRGGISGFEAYIDNSGRFYVKIWRD